MWAKSVVILLTSTFLLASSSAMAGSENDDDPRHFGYVGSETVDLHCCLLYRPPDLPPPACDQTNGLMESGIHGIGEGRFCGIARGREVRITLVDEMVESPQGSVYCPTHEGPYQVFGISVPYQVRSYRYIGETGPEPSFPVPHDCMQTESKNGATDLLVILKPGKAVAGNATLIYTD